MIKTSSGNTYTIGQTDHLLRLIAVATEAVEQENSRAETLIAQCIREANRLERIVPFSVRQAIIGAASCLEDRPRFAQSLLTESWLQLVNQLARRIR